MKVSLADIRRSLPDYKKKSDSQYLWARFVSRPLSVPLTWLLLRLGFTANQVTLFSIGLNGGAAYVMSRGDYPSFVAGAVMFNLALFLDSADGNMARATRTSSALGWMLDGLDSELFYIAFFIPIGLGVMNSGDYDRFFNSPWIFLGLGTAATVSVLFYRNFRMRLHLSNMRSSGGPLSDPDEVVGNGFGRRWLILSYGNVVSPAGSLLALVLLAAVLQAMDVFILVYGVLVPVVIVLAVMYHLWKFLRRSSRVAPDGGQG